MVCIHLGHFPSRLAALLALLLLPLPSMLSGPTPPCPVAHAKDLALHGEDKRAHPRHTDRRRGPTTKIGAPWSRAAPAVGACDGSAGVGASTVSFSFVPPGGRGSWMPRSQRGTGRSVQRRPIVPKYQYCRGSICDHFFSCTTNLRHYYVTPMSTLSVTVRTVQYYYLLEYILDP